MTTANINKANRQKGLSLILNGVDKHKDKLATITLAGVVYSTDTFKKMVQADIDASNAASMRLHAKFGFVQAGHFREVGWKFDRWLDLVFVQRFVDPPGSTR